jgi:uncharacterized cupredoxin-like copper-binding protein
MTARRGWLIAALVACVGLLVGSVAMTAAWARTDDGSFGAQLSVPHMWRSAAVPNAPEPTLPGALVRVSLTSMGGGMMGGRRDMPMFLSVDRARVPAGTVSFLATNTGSVAHELLVLPLAPGQSAGRRAGREDGTGDAANNDAEGSGHGIPPGARSWVTVTLTPGRYELVCNIPGHYAAGMYQELVVS